MSGVYLARVSLCYDFNKEYFLNCSTCLVSAATFFCCGMQGALLADGDASVQGNVEFSAGRFEKAKELFTAAAEAWPLAAAAYSNRAAAAAKLNDPAAVVRDCTTVLGLASTDPPRYKALCRRGIARRVLGDLSGALKDFQVLSTAVSSSLGASARSC